MGEQRWREVIALEPDAEAYRRLSRNTAMDHTRITTLQVAAADRKGTVALTTGRDSEHRLLSLGESLTKSQQARAVTLDEVIGDRHDRGVKIDVEGGERLVLEALCRR